MTVPQSDVLFEAVAESLGLWIAWSALARQVLALAGRIRDKDLSATDNGAARAGALGSVLLHRALPDDLSQLTASNIVTAVVDEWLSATGVRVSFAWQRGRAELSITPGDSVLGALGLHLATVVSRSDGMWLCDGCGLPHLRERAPKRGQGAYCGRAECRRQQARTLKRLSRSRTKEHSVDKES